jgi:hypothetical protein
MIDDLSMPRLPVSGHLRSAAGKAQYQAELAGFYAGILRLASTLEFQVSTRGWCYILENAGAVVKGQFDKVERLLTEGRKSGQLPLDICAEDSARQFDGLEKLNHSTPAEYAQTVYDFAANAHKDYTPVSFWESQHYYLQLLVEKIDLKSLFAPICTEYRIPHANTRGWSDLHVRADMMRRFRDWEAKGKRPVLLYCGDFDPVGLQISDMLRSNMAELSGQVGWSPDNVIIDRFGLNLNFINAHGLTWIDGLETGSGGDLAKSGHPDHHKRHVQDYLRQYGAQKVEVNAMVVRPDESRALLRATLLRYLPADTPAQYEARLAPVREQVRMEFRRLLQEH